MEHACNTSPEVVEEVDKTVAFKSDLDKYKGMEGYESHAGRRE